MKRRNRIYEYEAPRIPKTKEWVGPASFIAGMLFMAALDMFFTGVTGG